jgi:hypothetical protein
MSTQIQRRRGTTAQHSTFTGANAELTVDTDKEVVVVHDGTTAGGYPLMRENASNSALALGSAATPSLKFTGDLNTGIYSPGADQVAVSTGGTGRLFVDANGNVGVGPIQSPSWASASSTVLSILDSAFSNVAALRVVGPTTITEVGAGPSFTFAGSFSNHPYQLYTNSIERLRITSAGLVGIGTSAPGMKLTVNDTTTAQIQLGYNDSIYGRIGRNSSGNYEFSSYENGSNLLFGTTGTTGSTTERARIDSSGRLLVGTSTARSNLYGSSYVPFTQFESSGATTTRGVSITYNASTSTAGPILSLISTRGTSAGSNTLVASGDEIGFIDFMGTDGTKPLTGAAIFAQVDGTPSANDMPGRIVLATTADGASTPTERMRITSTGQVRLAGAGITFNGDTAAANELDDYEEGTWTATLDTWSGTAPTTTVTATGQYTKIGRLVHVEVQFSNVSTAGASGNVKITGLPFSGSTGNAANGNCSTYLFDFPSGVTSLAFQVSGSNIAFYISGDNIAWDNLLYSAGSGRYLSIAASYIV